MKSIHLSRTRPDLRGTVATPRPQQLVGTLGLMLSLVTLGCATTEVATQSLNTRPEQVRYLAAQRLMDAVLADSELNVVLRVVDGADPNGKTKDGRLPLNEATRHGDLAIMEFLISSGADVNAKDSVSRRGFGCFGTVPECDFDGYEYGGNSALHMVARYAQGREAAQTPRIKEMVRLLLDHGADINTGAHEGDTPLHYAAWRLEPDLVEELIKNGANVNAKDRYGQTPLAYAMESPLYKHFRIESFIANHARVVGILVEHGGK